MSNRTKLILGMVGAAAVGVAVGMMLAPDAGPNTRKRLASTAGGWGNSLSDLFSSAKESVGNLRRKGSDLADRTSERYSNVRESYS